jgi:ABC-type Fe3+/spermidine/putrescine transport system ATPase subunit
LSALDPENREHVQDELQSLHSILKNTIIHVTHDFEEAMALGTRVAVLGEGWLRQVGTPEQIFRHPESAYVAHFALVRNIFPGDIKKNSQGDTLFQTAGMELKVISDTAGPCYAAIRPEDIRIELQRLDAITINVFSGIVNTIVDKGATIQITISIPTVIKGLVTRYQYTQMGLKIGDSVSIYLDPSLIHIFKE